MCRCEFEEFNGDKAWFTGYIQETNKCVSVNLSDGKKIVKTIRIPSEQYQLNNNKFKIFCYTNTHLLSEEDNPDIIKAFNETKYSVGCCYDNAEVLTTKLVNLGYDAETYVGWLFICCGYPVHHAWTVIHIDKKDCVLDLSSQMRTMNEYMYSMGINTQDDMPLEEAREKVAKISVEIMKLSNFERCYPLGVPTPLFLYIGCPSTRQQGIDIFNRLRKKYPNHPSPSMKSIDSNGFTETQKKIVALQK